MKADAGKPDVAPKAKRKPVAKAKVEIAPQGKVGAAPKAKRKPASPSRAGKLKLA